jgi:DNA-binding winged helix-turn-helix (wHTH) protein/Tfp pilus assembly protein PilF
VENVSQSTRSTAAWQVGEWQFDAVSGDLHGPSGSARLEPKLLDLLRLLIEAEGAVVAHERLLDALWPGMIVGEDTVARSVSRLRRALGDSARAPRYIETLPKRGYRLLAIPTPLVPPNGAATSDSVTASPVSASDSTRRWMAALAAPVALLAVLLFAPWLIPRGLESPTPASHPTDRSPESELLLRADDHYGQYQFPDNEAALRLYERVLALRPEHPPALAGLANALVQKAMRWPQGTASGEVFHRLGDALAAGHMQAPANARLLSRARGLAERAIELEPASSLALRASGLAASAQGDFHSAVTAYRRALELDPDAWGVLINLADVLEITGHSDDALPYYEAAYAAMDRAYVDESARIRPWQASLGILIGDRYSARDQSSEAEAWYRRVLRTSPVHPQATRALADLLRQLGDGAAADALCAALPVDPEDLCGQPVVE